MSDRGVAKVAERQHGVIGWRQLRSLGFEPGAIRHRVAAGRLHHVHPEVYAVGHCRLGLHGRWMAAVLAGGDGAVLSHRSAAALWGIGNVPGSPVEVTADGRTRRGSPAILLHQARRFRAEDRTVKNAIPVTTLARTILDLAEVARRRELERAFEEAERLRLLDMRAIQDVREHSPGRHGLKPLRLLLASYHPPAPTRSELERRFVELCRDAALPPPAINVMVGGFEVDAAWPDHGLVVELDGFAFHRTRAAFERDRARDASLQLSGYRVLRLTDRRLANEPAVVVETLRALLEPHSQRKPMSETATGSGLPGSPGFGLGS